MTHLKVNRSKLSYIFQDKQHPYLNISLPTECKYRKHSSYKSESNQAHRQEGNASVVSAVGMVGWCGYHIACGQYAAESTLILIYTTKLTFKTFPLHDKTFKGWSRKCIRKKKVQVLSRNDGLITVWHGIGRTPCSKPWSFGCTNTHSDCSSMNSVQPSSCQGRHTYWLKSLQLTLAVCAENSRPFLVCVCETNNWCISV